MNKLCGLITTKLPTKIGGRMGTWPNVRVSQSPVQRMKFTLLGTVTLAPAYLYSFFYWFEHSTFWKQSLLFLTEL